MKPFGPITETSRVETTRIGAAEHSPVTERIGRYLFWALVAAVLLARAIYAPTSHPVAASTFQQAKTEVPH
jgi:hypothetical protein